MPSILEFLQEYLLPTFKHGRCPFTFGKNLGGEHEGRAAILGRKIGFFLFLELVVLGRGVLFAIQQG